MAIHSMTGYGSASGENDSISVRIEIKALNGKFLEINTRLPKSYQAREVDLRKLLQNRLVRGSVQLLFNVENKAVNTSQYRINHDLAKFYYEEITQLGFELGANVNDAFLRIMEYPDVIAVSEEDENLEENWKLIKELTESAADSLMKFREEEGLALGKSLEENVLKIKEELQEIKELEGQRIQLIRDRISNNLEEFIGMENVDKNRFEQELVYFMEKLDIAEEKTRLQQHCQFFLDNLYKENNGKKLGFIAQEMGREINTLGAKAYHVAIQQHVVVMKEELEKIKEQVLNIL